MGGGGKGGSQAAAVKPTYTDPVNGMSFTDDPNIATDTPFRPNDPAGALAATHYQSGADKLNAEITQRMAGEKTISDQKAADAQAAKDKVESDFQARASGAKTQASQNYNDYFTGQGVDPTKYSKQISDAISTSSNNVADLDPNPQGKYAATGASDLYNQLTSGQQSKNLAGYNKVFDPSYAITALDGSLIDPSVNSILSSQYDPLGTQLTNAQKRGSLTQQGYDAALAALNTSKTGATATVSKLARGVLDTDRGGLNDYIGTGRTAAGAAPLNTSFSTDPYVAGANDLVSKDKSNFGGDVQNAVGNTKFSDLTTLLNAGGSAQGANDPSAANPSGAVGPNGAPIGGTGGGDLSPQFLAQQALANEKRGLGTQGAF